MKWILLLTAYSVAASLAFVPYPDSEEWEVYKKKFNKKYRDHKADAARYALYEMRKREINEHNALYEKGLVSYAKEINRFTDMYDRELMEFKCLFNMMTVNRNETWNTSIIFLNNNLPVNDSVDWRSKGAVTPVKDQKHCLSCWAFSSTGAMESQHFLKTGKLVSLSEQNLIDCSKNDHGCKGGNMESAFRYVIENKGIDTEASYPYEDKQGSCKFNKDHIGATFSKYVMIPSGDEKALKEAVAQRGPVSVGIDVTGHFYQYQAGDVFYDPTCNPQNLTHGVLVVGYGEEKGKKYWLVKNSWGETWGDGGYIKMARDRDNNCGIATQASYPEI